VADAVDRGKVHGLDAANLLVTMTRDQARRTEPSLGGAAYPSVRPPADRAIKTAVSSATFGLIGNLSFEQVAVSNWHVRYLPASEVSLLVRTFFADPCCDGRRGPYRRARG
jgi:hypothetical protein